MNQDSEIEKFYQENNVPQDFDYLFYQKVYPDVKQYYQPSCPVPDRLRLYYHWYLYGKQMGRARNSTELNNFFKPTVNKRQIKSSSSRLGIITTYFNPCGYKALKNNYNRFYNHIKHFGDVFPVELSLDGDFFIQHQNAIRIQGNDRNIMWQKEALLNIGLEYLPKEYQNVAWLDCDIIFLDKHWLTQLHSLLDDFYIVQLFSTVYKNNANNQRITEHTNKSYFFPDGASGYAWAGRREILDEIKFLDTQILGMADTIMAQAFQGQQIQNFLNNQPDSLEWYNKTLSTVEKSCYYLNTEIEHMYHGQDCNKVYTYNDRYVKIFGNENYLETIYKNNDKIWQFKPDSNKETQKSVLNFFKNRQEDDHIINLNTYFDKIYIINLKKDYQTKYLKLKQKTDALNLNVNRFEAINGEQEDYNIKYNYHPYIQNKATYGCLLSHIKIIQEAKDNNYSKILILEDDVKFCNTFIFESCMQNFLQTKNWKLLYLGASQHLWNDIEYLENHYLANTTWGCFAYAIDSSVYDDILRLNQINPDWPIDMIMVEIQNIYFGKCYVLYPNLCIADVTQSDLRDSRDQQIINKQNKWDILTYL
jgi:GR25 family glycosyltransferase involved in LPS biosynthesis